MSANKYDWETLKWQYFQYFYVNTETTNIQDFISSLINKYEN